MTNREEFDYSMQIACIQPVSYYPATTPLVRLGIGLNWLWERKGVGGTKTCSSLLVLLPPAPASSNATCSITLWLLQAITMVKASGTCTRIKR